RSSPYRACSTSSLWCCLFRTGLLAAGTGADPASWLYFRPNGIAALTLSAARNGQSHRRRSQTRDGSRSTMAFEQRRQQYLSAVGFDELLAIDGLPPPVRTLDQNIRPHLADDLLGAYIIEHHHVIHHLERGENMRALGS